MNHNNYMLASTSLPTLLETYKPFDELEALQIKQLKQFLAESNNAYDHSNLLGHVVADAWIVNPSRDHVVLVEHLLVQKWMSPGGHCDGNPNAQEAAIREAEEEAGLINLIPLLDGELFDVNVGTVPTRKKSWGIEPAHLHFDICFAFEAPNNAPLKISDESTGLAWVAVQDIDTISFYPEHYRRPVKTLAGLLG